MYAHYTQSSSSVEDDCAKQITETVKFFNKDEVQNLLDDEVKLNELVTENPGVKSLDDEKKTMMAQNKSLAEYNLQLKPKLADHKAQLIQLYVNAQRARTEFDENKRKLEQLSSQLSLDTTLALLQTESAKSEEQSERTADDLLAGEMDMETFLSLYVEQRTVAHTRKVKVEKLQEIIRTQGTRAVNSNNPYSQSHNQPTPSQAPGAGYNRSMPYPIANPGYNGTSFNSPYSQNSFAAMPSLSSYK